MERMRSISKSTAAILTEIARAEGELRPARVVELATEASHPLHDHFEWDDGEAAHLYRLDQATRMIRGVLIAREDRPEKMIRAFVNVERNGGYETIASVLSSKEKRERLVALALEELNTLKQKYNDIKELAEVWLSITRAEGKQPIKRKQQTREMRR